jgi:hypothetical protein
MNNIRILPVHPDQQRSSAEKPVGSLIVSSSSFDLVLAYRALIRAFLRLPDGDKLNVSANESNPR